MSHEYRASGQPSLFGRRAIRLPGARTPLRGVRRAPGPGTGAAVVKMSTVADTWR